MAGQVDPTPVSADVTGLVELSRVLVSLAYQSLEAAPRNVSLPQFRALVLLSRSGPCTAGRLADELGLIGSTTTRLCDKLETIGWITRRAKPGNRRMVELALTRSGRGLVDQVLAVRAAELERILTHLPHQSRAGLAAVLPELVAAGDAAVEQSRAGWAI